MNPKFDVLLVEDEQITNDVLKLRIENLGYTTIAVNCPEEALLELENATFKLIVTDIVMPQELGQDIIDDCGFQFALNVFRKHPTVPVMFLTGRADEEIEVRIIEAGHSNQLNLAEFFRKPFPNKSFKDTLRTIIKSEK